MYSACTPGPGSVLVCASSFLSKTSLANCRAHTTLPTDKHAEARPPPGSAQVVKPQAAWDRQDNLRRAQRVQVGSAPSMVLFKHPGEAFRHMDSLLSD